MKLSAHSIMSDSVKNPQGEKLGDIKELMIDTQSGKVSYAVLDFGGFLGMGNKLFAVPWSALKVNTDDHTLMLDTNKEKLKDAEGFDKDDWPNFADRNFEQRIHDRYGATPYWN
ncbi:MAG: PRC-barrel domain-containing protein [Trueperaceae bacterium]|nr:PRC-barrel domain-containing protein [Trueperaceae bacterium]